MSLLPANFPLQHLSQVGISKLEWYYRHYVEEYYADYKFGHFLLASYASIPALLTPDLLYKIWQNFNAYKWQGAAASIHPIAVSDMLLSPLCTEVGFELYEMDQEIKLAMLQWLKIIEDDKQTLWAKRGIQTITNIAKFAGEYHSLPNSGQIRWGKSYSESQEIEALSYTQPEEAASRLLTQMNEQSVAHKEMDLLRTMEQFIKTQKKLERLHSSDHSVAQPFQQHVSQLEAVKNLLENNSNAFLEKLNTVTSLPNFQQGTISTGITIRMPEAVQQKIAETNIAMKKRRKKIFAGVMGFDHFATFNIQPFTFCRTNADQFGKAIENYANVLHCDLEIFQPPSDRFSRNDLFQLYNFYDQAADGDSCVFFYSGMGLMDNQYRIRDVIVDDDTKESLQQEEGFAGLTQHLNELLSKKDIHVLIITDIHGVYQVPKTFPVFNHTSGKGSVIFIKNFENDDEWLPAVETGIQPPENNIFSQSFFDILSEGSYRYNYHEIFTQLKLRMSMQGRQRPAKYSFPSSTAQRMFLTGEEKKIINYTLQYEQELGWKVDAGLRQGIRPSLPFMETIFKDVEGRRYTVQNVFEQYSIINEFNESIDKTFNLTLIQNALPKIKVAFSEEIDPQMREVLFSNIRQHNIFYIDLVEERNLAYYLIGNNENEYMLSRRENIRRRDQEQLPVIEAQRSPFEFIKAMEYIAQWQGVLEFDNRETQLSRNMVWFAFEKIEGKSLMQKNIDGITGEWIPDYAPVVLQYQKVNDEWLQPAIRCKATRVQNPLYVSVLYLDAEYGISTLGNMYVQPGEEIFISDLSYGNAESNTIPLQIPRQLLEKGVNEVTAYMKFFISSAPMDVEVLKQEGLIFAARPIKRGIENLRNWEGKLIDTTQTDWVAVTIPITLVQKENSKDEETKNINPFRGLNAYTEEDADVYFGREELVNQIKQAAHEFSILIISGPAGCGKTSLINAGLIPQLDGNVEKLALETTVDIDFILAELNRIRESGGRKFIVIDNYENLVQSNTLEIEEIERQLNELSYENTILIVIRKTTELVFKQSRIVGMIRERGSGKVIRPQHPRGWRIEMQPFNDRELGEMIRTSLQSANIGFEENLINILIRDSLQTFRSLPLLSLALTRLAEISNTERRPITEKDYAALGGLATLHELEGQYSFEEKVQEIYRGQPIIYADDPQKGRWGGRAERNRKILRAEISPSNIHNLYNLRAGITTTLKGKSMQGQVAFFVSGDFDNEIEYVSFINGEALIEKNILQPFTIGAYTNDGTLLELDLSTVEPFNDNSQLENIPDQFDQKVKDLYNSSPVRVTEDLQKGRWGGTPIAGNKEMLATIERSEVSGFFKVFIRIKSYLSADHLSGSAAFFLHDSYEETIVFRKAINGEISLTITAWQAFTVGAYLADGTMLELDLNLVQGVPEDFYVRNDYA